MTTELPGSQDDLSNPETLYGPSTSEGNCPLSELFDLVLGQSARLKVWYHYVNN